MQMALDRWVSTEEMIEILSRFKDDHVTWGDVYVRFHGNQSIPVNASI
jgi:hypothetical protein